MSNKHDITQYLVEPDFDKWLKEKGFDGECCKVELGKEIGFVRRPTFQQAFDFCEEKFRIFVSFDWNGFLTVKQPYSEVGINSILLKERDEYNQTRSQYRSLQRN